jgi:hypothetical protein
MSREEWERRNRADADFLDGTGVYQNALRIYVDEEYGYREWLWTYPGTIKELVEDWKEGLRPLRARSRCRHRTYIKYGQWSTFRGEFDRITWRVWGNRRYGRPTLSDHPVISETGEQVVCLEYPDSFHGQAHIHDEDDSYLKIGYYELYGLREVTEKIHVLDALAAI